MLKYLTLLLALLASSAVAATPSDEAWGAWIDNLMAEVIARVSVYGSACDAIPDWLREEGAKVIENMNRRKVAYKLEAAYLQMMEEKDKMDADAWCASAKPHIDYLLMNQPPTPERTHGDARAILRAAILQIV